MSDHISGPRALADPIGDITDVYAFPSPERPGHLVLVVNTLPFAQPSDGLSGRAASTASGCGQCAVAPPAMPRRSARARTSSSSTASSPSRGADGRPAGHLHAADGRVVDFAVGDEHGGAGGRDPGLRRPALGPVHPRRPRRPQDDRDRAARVHDAGSIYLDGKNVLGLVVELDCARFLGDAGLVAVVAETRTSGSLSVRIERVGRPEIKNLMLGPKQFDQVNRDLEIRDLYNMEDAFDLGAYQGAYRARLNANLAFWDGLDGAVDWPSTATASTR